MKTSLFSSPIVLNYVPNSNGILLNVNMEDGRGLPIYSYGANGNHPFAYAVRITKNLKFELQYESIYTALSIFYKLILPKNAAELVLVSAESRLNNFPVWAIVMPWDNTDIEEWKKNVENSVIFENLVAKSMINIQKGWAWVGPVHKDKLRIEAQRLFRVLQSIQMHGYNRNDGPDGDIVANILVNERNEWVWQSITGQHRVSVLSGLGYKTIPIRVMKIIRQEDVDFWPNVLNGLYTRTEALYVFNMVFNGNFSHVTKNWDDYLKLINRDNI